MEVIKKLRAATLGSRKEFKSERKEWGGEVFEIRQPSVAGRARIFRYAGSLEEEAPKGKKGKAEAAGVMQQVDLAKMQVWSVIECTYIPKSSEKVFTKVDYDDLMGRPAGDFVDAFAAIAMKLMNVDSEEDGKNSEETPIE